MTVVGIMFLDLPFSYLYWYINFLLINVLCNVFLYIYILQVVNKYIDQGVAELVPGVLFVDEVRNYINVHVLTDSF